MPPAAAAVVSDATLRCVPAAEPSWGSTRHRTSKTVMTTAMPTPGRPAVATARPLDRSGWDTRPSSGGVPRPPQDAIHEATRTNTERTGSHGRPVHGLRLDGESSPASPIRVVPFGPCQLLVPAALHLPLLSGHVCRRQSVPCL